MATLVIRTRFYPKTTKRPYGRLVARVVGGEHDGRKESFRYPEFQPDGHLFAAYRLGLLLGIEGEVKEVDFRNTGSTFEITY